MIPIKEKEINEFIEKGVNDFLNVLVESKIHSGLHPPKNIEKYKKMLGHEIEREVLRLGDEFIGRFQRGFKELWSHIHDVSEVAPHQTYKKILQELNSIVTAASHATDHIDSWIKKLDEADSMRALIGFSSDTMDFFYEIAYNLFKKNHIKEASDVFFFLCTLDPLVSNFWYGFGRTEQLQEHFTSALYGYSMAVLINPALLQSHLCSAECYVALNDTREAIHSLDLAIDYAANNTSLASMKEEALRRKINLKTLN